MCVITMHLGWLFICRFAFVYHATKAKNKCKLELKVCTRVYVRKCQTLLGSVRHRAHSNPSHIAFSMYSEENGIDLYKKHPYFQPKVMQSLSSVHGRAVSPNWWIVHINVHKYGDGGSRHRVVEARGADR